MNHDSEAERARFEAWRRRTAKMDPDAAVALHGFGDDADYEHRTTNAMWVGWQAALMSRQAPSTPDVSRECGKGDTSKSEAHWHAKYCAEKKERKDWQERAEAAEARNA